MKIKDTVGRRKFKQIENELKAKFPPRTRKGGVDLIGIATILKLKYTTVRQQWVRGGNMHADFANKLITLC